MFLAHSNPYGCENEHCFHIFGLYSTLEAARARCEELAKGDEHIGGKIFHWEDTTNGCRFTNKSDENPWEQTSETFNVCKITENVDVSLFLRTKE